jgi:uncharacterized protein (DUF4415 family)
MQKVISEDVRAELQALSRLTDEQIDTSDIPEQRDWKGAKRGLFYRPIKNQLTLRIDSDIIAWFKARVVESQGYQTSINNALREYVEKQEAK